jgi:ribose transport system substrate-binding protein
MKKGVSIGVLVLAIVLLICVSCKKQEEKSVLSQSEDISTAEDGKLKIGFSVISLTYPYYVSMLEGIQSAVSEKGWELVYTDAGTDVEKTINDCLDLIQKGIDALVIASWYGDSLEGVFEQANAAGIPVFLIDTGSLPPDGDYVTNIGTDNFSAGYLGGYWTAKYFCQQDMNEINFLSFTTATTVGRDRVDGYLEGLSQGGLKVNRLNEYLGNSRESYMSSCEDALTTYPRVDLIFGANAQAGLGSYDSVIAAGRSEVHIFGFDCEDDEIALIDAGTQYIASVKQLPRRMASQTIQNIEDYLFNGKTFDKSIAFPASIYTKDGLISSEDILEE